MLPLLTASFLAGLVGSPHCVGMCGGFAAACAGTARGAGWHAGRLGSYAALGAIAGAFGSALPGPGLVAAVVSAALLVWFAAALAGLVSEPTVRVPGLAALVRRAGEGSGRGSTVALGVASGLLPCGLVYAALAFAVAAGHPVAGAASMVAFGLGTVPALALLALGVRRVALRSLAARRVLAAFVLVLGLFSVATRYAAAGPGETHAPHLRPVPTSTPDAPDGGR